MSITLHADPLTIAYIALGAHAALDQAPASVRDSAGPEMHFIAEAIEHAAALDQLGYAVGDRLSGCWCYEVAEPFGEAWAIARLAGLPFDVPTEAARLVREACTPEMPEEVAIAHRENLARIPRPVSPVGSVGGA